MKFVIVLCFFIAAAAAGGSKEEFTQKLTQVANSCTTDSVIANALVKSYAGQWNIGEETHCPMKCLLEKIKFIKANGDLDGDYIVEHCPPGQSREKAVAAVEKCKGITGANECERGFNTAKCLQPALT